MHIVFPFVFKKVDADFFHRGRGHGAYGFVVGLAWKECLASLAFVDQVRDIIFHLWPVIVSSGGGGGFYESGMRFMENFEDFSSAHAWYERP